jgi:cysteine synthase
MHRLDTLGSPHRARTSMGRRKLSRRTSAAFTSSRLNQKSLAVLSGRAPGSHNIERIGIGFVPPLWERDRVDEIVAVSTQDAKAMTRRLAREEGIFTGTSSGANVVAALRVAGRFGSAATVATLIVDSGQRYMSTDVFR